MEETEWKKKKKGFLVRYGMEPHLELLTVEQCGLLFLALVKYAEHGVEPDFNGELRMAFSFLRADIDHDMQQYVERCEKNRDNALNRNRPQPTASDGTQPQPMATDRTGKERTGKENIYSPSFLEFWTLYPKRKGKADAFKAWEKLNPDDELKQTIFAALQRQVASEDWHKNGGQYIPYPQGWLSGRRWEDELAEEKQKGSVDYGAVLW